MQSYKYKRNLTDTDLLDYYHISNAPIQLYDTICLHYTKPPEVDRTLPVYGLPS